MKNLECELDPKYISKDGKKQLAAQLYENNYKLSTISQLLEINWKTAQVYVVGKIQQNSNDIDICQENLEKLDNDTNAPEYPLTYFENNPYSVIYKGEDYSVWNDSYDYTNKLYENNVARVGKEEVEHAIFMIRVVFPKRTQI